MADEKQGREFVDTGKGLREVETVGQDLFGENILKDVLLRDKFLEPPFTILDTKQGSWQQRKQRWKVLGIQSEVGRDAKCMPGAFGGEVNEAGLDSFGRKPMCETSIFDPALTELMYRWFCPEGGHILDPFAGGSVRGIVAQYLGFKYTGFELREEQVVSNRAQAVNILPADNQPAWHVGDAEALLDTDWKKQWDFIFSCPPYFDLEVYSNLREDLSNMDYNSFSVKYKNIISLLYQHLKPGAFACFVVSDIRDKNGNYRLFPEMTTMAFVDAGFKPYNKAVLAQPLGTAMLRANRIFSTGKKLIKVHEEVLIFKK